VKLHLIPNRVIIGLGLAPLDPGAGRNVATTCSQRLRVTAAHVAAEFPQSWVERLARRAAGRIPGVRRLLRDHEVAQRAWATALVRLEHVSVDDQARPPNRCNELPIAAAGREISVRVTNTGDRPLVTSVFIEGVLS
jgi:hypothetical protein